MLFASLLFYSWNNPKYTLLLIFSILINWSSGLIISRQTNDKLRKAMLTICVLVDLALLGYYKYFNFFVDNITQISPKLFGNVNVPTIILPLGISFFTFQGISYVVDVYRKEIEVQSNLLNVALYIAMFPQLVAGPIVRYQKIAKSIDDRIITIENIGCGFRRFAYGMAKKIIVADTFGAMADQIIDFPKQWTFCSVWMAIMAYSLQIYYDFSGYSDMAIGMAKMFGFDFDENFNYPYIAKSITDFWRRWHISLSTWFRDYVYIPCGGNRVNVARHIRNIIIVWCLTGIWHGANWTFMCWGLYYGVLLIIEKYVIPPKIISKIPTIIKWISTMVLVMIGWVFFRLNSISIVFEYLRKMCTPDFSRISYTMVIRNVLSYYWIWIIGFVGIFPKKRLLCILNRYISKVILVALDNIYTIVIFVLSIMFCVSSSYNAFIYFNF